MLTCTPSWKEFQIYQTRLKILESQGKVQIVACGQRGRTFPVVTIKLEMGRDTLV